MKFYLAKVFYYTDQTNEGDDCTTVVTVGANYSEAARNIEHDFENILEKFIILEIDEGTTVELSTVQDWLDEVDIHD